jgi:alpha-galactosidase
MLILTLLLATALSIKVGKGIASTWSSRAARTPLTHLPPGNRLRIDSSSSPDASEQALSPTPPMGWNSWDSFGTTVTEADVKSNAEWMALNLKKYGWQYVVVDMEWFVTNPTPEGNSKNSSYALDENGRYIPDPGRFPSSANGAGFKPLADYVHSLGLKFGIHILRGIPKQAVDRNLPIAETAAGKEGFGADDAANRSDTCPWNYDNYGMDAAKPAAQAYYDSIAALYASWGVDFVKADCIASHPYKGDDIRMLSLALRKTGRAIVLSLSPGEAPMEKLGELRSNAQMWRISDDVWDLWHSTTAYPQGLNDQFPRAAKWADKAQAGHWPDADMVPLGYLGPAPGWGGKARASRLTHDEQRSLMTLWCIFGSPLMMGGNLPMSDEWTKSLLTNADVLFVDQHAVQSHPVVALDDTAVWLARSSQDKQVFLAVFNRSQKKQTLRYEWTALGLPKMKYGVRDLWQRRDLGRQPSLAAELAPHSCVLYRLAD